MERGQQELQRRVTTPTSCSMKEDLLPVKDLRNTLSEEKLLQEFRTFLRSKLDRNRNVNLDVKKTFEQWLDFVIICEQVRALPESELVPKIALMIKIGTIFLGKPPSGYNIALKSQLNRKELITHCQSLLAGSCKVPDTSLLSEGYEYVWSKLEQKHDIFKKTARPSTKLALVLCSLS
jgi:hypothetical protein